MTYIAQKPCSFAGLNYRIGDEIPDAVLHPGAIKGLISMGVISEGTKTPADDEFGTVAQSIHISISTDKGPLDLNVTPEGLNEVFAVLTNTGATAEEIVKQMTDPDALILLDLSDSRKGIKAAAEARAEALSEEESAGEQ